MQKHFLLPTPTLLLLLLLLLHTHSCSTCLDPNPTQPNPTMKTNHPKLKTPLFTCGLFRHCSQTTLSPTTPNSPPLPFSHSTPPSSSLPPLPPSLPPPPPPPPPQEKHKQKQKQPQVNPSNPKKTESSTPTSSSSSSSASTSQSFTQWRFPLINSPLHHSPNPNPNPSPPKLPEFASSLTNYQELFHLAELQLASGSDPDRIACLHLLERTLVPNPISDLVCPIGVMRVVVGSLRDEAVAKPATKILLALCLAEGNRRVAVEAGAVGTVVEVAMEMEGSSAERAMAALELACTVAEGAAELRAHALAVPVMVAMMGKMVGRGKEYAISALAVIYGRRGGGSGGCGEEGHHAPAEEVARAVELALQQGDCTERGRRKGSLLLKALREYNNGGGEPLDLAHGGAEHGNERS